MKYILRFLPVPFLLLAAGLPAQAGSADHPAPSERHAGAGATSGQQGSGHGNTEDQIVDMEAPDFFLRNFSHLVPHAMFLFQHSEDDGEHTHSEGHFTFYNNNLFQAIAVVLILLIFGMVKNSFGGGPTGGPVRVFRGWCHWLRDEVVYSVMGREEGRVWAPFFIYLFFFLAFLNLLGLVPIWGHTATASFYVTGTMACITFACMLGFGFKQQGVVGFFVNLLPHGLPVALIPLMAPIELIGLFIKPFALMVRLFANMLGGHLVVYSFLGLIFLLGKMMIVDAEMPALAYLTALPAVGMSVFINIIEGFIALLQAYVFTYLSVIFVHQAMHPSH